MTHVGEYRPDGVLVGCSCGWEGGDIEAHVRDRIDVSQLDFLDGIHGMRGSR